MFGCWNILLATKQSFKLVTMFNEALLIFTESVSIAGASWWSRHGQLYVLRYYSRVKDFAERRTGYS